MAEAQSEDALLKKTAELGHALQPLIVQGKLSGIQSPDQFILATTEQQKLQNRLRELTKLPDSWKPLTEIGIPRKTVRDALLQAADTQPLSLSDGLNTDLAEAWRSLYLGEVEPGRFAAVVRLNGMADEAAVRAAVQHISGVHWADKRAHLNELSPHAQSGRMVETGFLCVGMAAFVENVRFQTRQQNPCRAAGRRHLHRCRTRFGRHSRQPVCHVRPAFSIRHRRGLCRLCRHCTSQRAGKIRRYAACRSDDSHFLCPARHQQHARCCRVRHDGYHRRGIQYLAGRHIIEKLDTR